MLRCQIRTPVHLLSQLSLWFLCSLGKGCGTAATADPWYNFSWQQALKSLFLPFSQGGTGAYLSPHGSYTRPGQASCTSWLASSLMARQGEHQHAAKGRRWQSPFLWQVAIGAIYLYPPNTSFAVLRSSGDLCRADFRLHSPLTQLSASTVTAEEPKPPPFPASPAEDGSGRNQSWHLLHVVLGPRAVNCSSMEQTCLLLHRLVCGEQQTLGREGDRHRYRLLIIKHQEP